MNEIFEIFWIKIKLDTAKFVLNFQIFVKINVI